jgi:uncharacterized protein (DUF302 family)
VIPVKELRYGMSIEVPLSYEEAIRVAKEALKEEGFGVLTEIDVRKTLKEKVGADFQPYVILGACNPALAFTALQDDIDVGLLLPCNVTVREENGKAIISIMDPQVMSRLSAAPGLAEVARIAREKLSRALAQMEAQALARP